jgi:hypothetical protein
MNEDLEINYRARKSQEDSSISPQASKATGDSSHSSWKSSPKGTWDLRGLAPLPLLPLVGCWMLATLVDAPRAVWFMWLVFGCAALLTLAGIVERLIDVYRRWTKG